MTVMFLDRVFRRHRRVAGSSLYDNLDQAVDVFAHRIPLGWQRLKDSPGALLRRSGVVGRLAQNFWISPR